MDFNSNNQIQNNSFPFISNSFESYRNYPNNNIFLENKSFGEIIENNNECDKSFFKNNDININPQKTDIIEGKNIIYIFNLYYLFIDMNAMPLNNIVSEYKACIFEKKSLEENYESQKKLLESQYLAKRKLLEEKMEKYSIILLSKRRNEFKAYVEKEKAYVEKEKNVLKIHMEMLDKTTVNPNDE